MTWLTRLLGFEKVGVREAQSHVLPTVQFDSSQVDDEVRKDLWDNLCKVKAVSEDKHATIYEAAIDAVSKGGALHILASALLADIPGITRAEAGRIALSLNVKATALMTTKRHLKTGIVYATWSYSGAPCYASRKPNTRELQRDVAHQAVDGKRYRVETGMLVNSIRTWPGREDGCKCVAKAVIPGFR